MFLEALILEEAARLHVNGPPKDHGWSMSQFRSGAVDMY